MIDMLSLELRSPGPKTRGGLVPTNRFDATELIRNAKADELRTICHIHKEAFEGASEAKLVELLHCNRKANPSLVVTVAGEIVASVVFSPVTVTTAPKESNIAGLGPVAVLPEYQRRGIGSRLIRAGLDACRAAQYGAVVVLGNPQFYLRFGFLPAMDYGLSNQYVQDAHFMIRELHANVLSNVSGMVRYSAEFRLAGC